MTRPQHHSVLLEEVLAALDLAHRHSIIDATLGLGGHSLEILSHPHFHGRVLGIDQDPSHLELAQQRLSNFSDCFSAVQMNFAELDSLLSREEQHFDGILFDLGVASPHFDVPERGFSIHLEGPLDMRMNPQDSKTAAEILNEAEEYELVRLFREYGEEPLAKPIAKKICRVREEKPLQLTTELADLVTEVYRSRHKRTSRHPAAQVFQALRIAVNNEMEVLKKALAVAIDRIDPGGIIVVISYHSLEDRLVKQAFKKAADPCTCPPKFPSCSCGLKPKLRILTKKPIIPTDVEVALNPRARSAKMRVAEKI